MKILVEFDTNLFPPPDRQYAWTDAHKTIVRTYVYRFEDVEIHIPNTEGHFIVIHTPTKVYEGGLVKGFKATP